MDPPSECYHLFTRLPHLPAFSLEAFPFTNEELDAAGLRGEGKSLGHFTRLSHTYHLPCRCFRVSRTDNRDDEGAPQTPRQVPYLLSTPVPHSSVNAWIAFFHGYPVLSWHKHG